MYIRERIANSIAREDIKGYQEISIRNFFVSHTSLLLEESYLQFLNVISVNGLIEDAKIHATSNFARSLNLLCSNKNTFIHSAICIIYNL